MILFGFPFVLWLFGLIQFAGVAFLAQLQLSAGRLPENCPAKHCRIYFFLVLTILGLKITWLLAHGWTEWIYGCPTFALMILGSTFDSGRSRRAAC